MRRREALAELHQPELSRVRPVRSAGRSRPLRRGDLRAGHRARDRPVHGRGESAGTVRAGRPRDRLDAVSDPRPRTACVRHGGLLAFHAARAADAAGAAGLIVGPGRTRGATAAVSRATSICGRATGAGTHCATSPTSPCRCGHSRATRPEVLVRLGRPVPGSAAASGAGTPCGTAKRSRSC